MVGQIAAAQFVVAPLLASCRRSHESDNRDLVAPCGLSSGDRHNPAGNEILDALLKDAEPAVAALVPAGKQDEILMLL